MDYDGKYHHYCFLDETNVDDVISIDDDGSLNIEKNNQSDLFIAVSTNVIDSDLDKLRETFITFESKYKKIYNFNGEAEFKSTTIKKKNFKYGLKTLNKNAFDFYNDFFDMLENNNISFYTSAFSKIEYLVLSLITIDKLSNARIAPDFYYTLAKFLKMYAGLDIYVRIKDLSSIQKRDSFKRYLIKKLNDVLNETKNVPKYSKQNSVYRCLINILSVMDFDASFDKKIVYNSNLVFDGLLNLIDSMHFDDVCIVIDGDDVPLDEKKLYQNVDYYFDTYHFVNSKSEPMIRISDHIAGFMGRVISSIQSNLRIDKTKYPYESGREFEEKNKRICLSEGWFDLSEKQFYLYKKINKIFNQNQKDYWCTYSGLLCDDYVYFYGLLCYIGSYDTYSEYSEVDIRTHSEYCNREACARLMQRYSQWYMSLNDSIKEWADNQNEGLS